MASIHNNLISATANRAITNDCMFGENNRKPLLDNNQKLIQSVNDEMVNSFQSEQLGEAANNNLDNHYAELSFQSQQLDKVANNNVDNHYAELSFQSQQLDKVANNNVDNHYAELSFQSKPLDEAEVNASLGSKPASNSGLKKISAALISLASCVTSAVSLVVDKITFTKVKNQQKNKQTKANAELERGTAPRERSNEIKPRAEKKEVSRQEMNKIVANMIKHKNDDAIAQYNKDHPPLFKNKLERETAPRERSNEIKPRAEKKEVSRQEMNKLVANMIKHKNDDAIAQYNKDHPPLFKKHIK